MFVQVGLNLAEGLAQGISNGQSAVINAVAELCVQAITTAQQKLDENSPSKIFDQIGRYLDLGLVQGVESEEEVSAKASLIFSQIWTPNRRLSGRFSILPM